MKPASSAPRRPRFPFWAKLTLMSTVLVLIPTAVVGISVVRETTSGLETASRDLRIVVGHDVAGSIRTVLAGAEDSLDGVGQIVIDPTLDAEQTESVALALVSGDATIDHVAIYAADGQLIDVLREDAARGIAVPEELDVGLRDEAQRSNAAVGATSSSGSAPRVQFVVPLRSDGTVTGYAASSISLDSVSRQLTELAEGHFRELPDAVYVVDSDYRVLLHADAGFSGRRGAPPELAPAIDEAVDYGVVLSTEYSVDGEELVGSLVPVRGVPWVVVSQVPRAVAYGPVITIERVLYATLAIAAFLAIALAIVVARRITKPIRQLAGFAEDLAARRFESRVTVQTTDELAFLGDAMSAAAADLQASEKRIREEEAIRADLGRYVSAEIVDKVVRREQDMALGGQRRDISVMFADVVAFTPLTQKLAAEETVTILNELFTILTEIVFRHGGTVDKFVGDCVMAIWGAPEDQPDHAARALRAAEDMQSWLEAGNAGWRQRFGVSIELAIGVHSGEAVVGNIGSETRMEYTAIGDVVNVAARLETIARPQQILVTAETKLLAGDAFEYNDLGPRTLSGRDEPVRLFEVRT